MNYCFEHIIHILLIVLFVFTKNIATKNIHNNIYMLTQKIKPPKDVTMVISYNIGGPYSPHVVVS